MFFISVLITRIFKGSQEIYTYKVDENFSDSLFLGQRVIVDFAGSSVLGFILDFQKETNENLENLKFCTRFLDERPVISKTQFTLFKELEKLSFFPKIDLFLEVSSPLVNLKATEKLHLIDKETQTTLPFKTQDLSLTKTLKQKFQKEILRLKKLNLVRPYFSVETSKVKKTQSFLKFSEPLSFSDSKIQFNLLNTKELFKKVIKDAEKQGGKVLVCLKNSLNLTYFINLINSVIPPEQTLIYSRENLNTDTKISDFETKAAKSDFLVVLGFEKALFQEISGLKHLILIDDFLESKSETGVNSADLVKLVAEIKSLDTYVYSTVPSLDLAYQTKQDNINYLKELGVVKQVLVSDLLKEADLTLVSKAVLNNLKYNLANNLNTLFLTDQTVYANLVKCTSCGNVFRCMRCFDYLRYDSLASCFYCKFCNLYMQTHLNCEVCQKYGYSLLSVGAQYFYQYFLKELKVTDTANLKFLNEFLVKKEVKITDRLVFSNLENVSIDYLKSVKTICVYLPELLFNSKNPYFNHLNYLKLTRILKSAKNASVYLISQTTAFELDTLLNKDIVSFYQNEKNFRRENGLTPFGYTYLLFAEGQSLFGLFKELFGFLKSLDLKFFSQPEELFKHILNKEKFVLRTRLFSKIEISAYLVEKCAKFTQQYPHLKLRLQKEGIWN